MLKYQRVTDRLGGIPWRLDQFQKIIFPVNKLGQKHHFWTQRMPPSSNLKFLSRNSTILIFWFFHPFLIKPNDMFEMTEDVVCFVCLFIWDLHYYLTTFESSNYCSTTVSLQDSTLIYILYNVRCTVEIGVIPVKITNPVNYSWVKI